VTMSRTVLLPEAPSGKEEEVRSAAAKKPSFPSCLWRQLRA